MKLPEWLFFVSAVVCTLSFGLGFLLTGSHGLAVVAFSIGCLWTISHWKEWSWGDLAGFAIYSFLLAVGGWQGVAIPWLVVGIASLIITWDIARLSAQMKRVERIVDEDGLIRRHLLRLGSLLVIGLCLSILALNLRLMLSFDLGLILSLVMIITLSRVITFLREN